MFVSIDSHNARHHILKSFTPATAFKAHRNKTTQYHPRRPDGNTLCAIIIMTNSAPQTTVSEVATVGTSGSAFIVPLFLPSFFCNYRIDSVPCKILNGNNDMVQRLNLFAQLIHDDAHGIGAGIVVHGFKTGHEQLVIASP